MPRRTMPDLPPQTGRTVIVTGGGRGIGLATTAAFAAAGARVIAAVRDPGRAAAALADLPGTVQARRLDLADLASVRAFAAGIDEPVAILINNAGVIGGRYELTADGFERQFGTNHLGHFALTNLLLPRITDRVVSVASAAHRSGSLDPDDPRLATRRLPGMLGYARSKLANLLFILHLELRLEAVGSPVRAHATHPGVVSSGPAQTIGPPTRLIGRAFRSPEVGCAPSVFAATRPLPGASYVGPGHRIGDTRPRLIGRSAAASDPELAERLWRASERLTGIGFPPVAGGDTPTGDGLSAAWPRG